MLRLMLPKIKKTSKVIVDNITYGFTPLKI